MTYARNALRHLTIFALAGTMSLLGGRLVIGQEPQVQKLPEFLEIFRSLVPVSEVEEAAGVKELLERGHVEKWNHDIRFFFAAHQHGDIEVAKNLVAGQLPPFLSSMSEATGLGFDQVSGLTDANVVMFFSAQAEDISAIIGHDQLSAWFGAPIDDYEPIRNTIDKNLSDCFRFVFAPDSEIVRAIAFVSTSMPSDEIETCVARNLLFAVGLRGASRKMSAKVHGEASRSIGVLDTFGLNLIYKPGVMPGMSLRQAVEVQGPTESAN